MSKGWQWQTEMKGLVMGLGNRALLSRVWQQEQHFI